MPSIGPLQNPGTWYGINYAGTQATQWDFQTKVKSGWTGTSSFVFEVPMSPMCPLKRKAAVLKSLRFRNNFSGRLVWTIVLTVEI